MLCDDVSCSGEDISYVFSRQGDAIAIEADGFIGVGNVVEEGIGWKATADISICTLRLESFSAR